MPKQQLTVVKIIHFSSSLSGERLGSVLLKCPPDHHHSMKCEHGDILCVRTCASGDCLKHMLILDQIHEFRIHDVYSGQSDMHVLRNQQVIVFAMRDVETSLVSRCVFQPLFTKPMK